MELSRSPAPNVRSLSKRLLGAAAWVVFGAGAAHVLRLGGNLVATRLLVPEMFGLVAIAGLVPMILSLLSDIGFRENVCRSPNGDDPTFLNTLWSVQLIRGWSLWGACLLLAASLHVVGAWGWLDPRSTYGDPRLPWVIAVSSMSIAIGSLHSTKVFSENRHLRMTQLLKIELLAQLVGVVLMIVLAWATESIWSILLSGLISTGVYVVLSHTWLPGQNNRLVWDRDALQQVMTFGKWLFWSSAFTVIASNADKILLGGFVAPEVLGFYSIASNLVGAVDTLVSQVFSRVAMPGLSEVARNNPQRLAAAYFKLRKRFDPLLLLLSGALFSAGHLIIDLLYDPRYRSAGPMLEILSLSLLASRYSLAQTAYLAINRPQYQVVLNVARLVTIYAMAWGAYLLFGLKGALVAIALRDIPILPLIFYFNAKHAMNSVKLELGLLLIWPVGYALGQGVMLLAR